MMLLSGKLGSCEMNCQYLMINQFTDRRSSQEELLSEGNG